MTLEQDDTARAELLAASDETIDDAVMYADPLVLRGLLYQLTGDEEVAGTTVAPVRGFVGGEFSVGVTDPAQIAVLRGKAAAYLKAHRDAGAGLVGPGRATGCRTVWRSPAAWPRCLLPMWSSGWRSSGSIRGREGWTGRRRPTLRGCRISR